jgi:TatD DNase family protein
MELIDSHAHLEFQDFDTDRSDMIQRAADQGISKILSIGTRADGWDTIYGLTQTYTSVFMTVGIHPCECSIEHEANLEKKLLDFAQKTKVVGLGETGLDAYHDPCDLRLQERFFRTHIQVAQTLDLPVVIHARDAEDDMLRILKEVTKSAPLRAVMHCFTGSASMAEACLDLGCYISFSGIITFKNAVSVREALKVVPLNRLLVETDAPYLAPQPYRGQRNEPAYTLHTAEKMAEVKETSLQEIAKTTTHNFYTLFNRVPQGNL